MTSRNLYSQGTFSTNDSGDDLSSDLIVPTLSEESNLFSYFNSQDSIIPAINELDSSADCYIVATDDALVIISSEVYEFFKFYSTTSYDSIDISLSELVVFGSFFTTQDVVNPELDETSIFDSVNSFNSFDIIIPELESEGASPLKGALIRENRRDIYALIKNYLITDYYHEDEEVDVFIRLIARIFGELKYYSEYLPELFDIDNCPEDFLPFLANFHGYDIPEGIKVRKIRLILKHYLDIRRRRGTTESVLNAVRYAGREEFGYLYLEEGIDVRTEELNKLGLIYVDGANINIKEIMDSIQETKPAGVKIAYALKYGIPRWIKTRKFSMAFKAEYEPKLEDLNINLDEETVLSQNWFDSNEIITDFLVEDFIVNSIFSGSDLIDLSSIEDSQVVRSGLAIYGTKAYGNTRYAW